MNSALRITLSLGISLALAASSAVGQQLYRWVDKNGKVTYSQDPPPAGAATKVEQKQLKSSVVETGGLPYELQQTARNFPVTLYTGPDCGDPCKNGLALLSKRGIPFKEISVVDTNGIAELKKISGKEQLPVLIVGRTVATGFTDGQWNSTLDSVGYPKTSPLSARPPVAAAKSLATGTSAPPAPEKPRDNAPAASKQ
jgi:glutaredoxin